MARGLAEVFVFLGAFLLPLLDREAVPAALALLLLLSGAGKRHGADRYPLCAAASGWLASWLWRSGGAHLRRIADLALLGPALAFGAMDRPGRSLRNGLLAGGAVCGLAALGQILFARAAPLRWAAAAWPWGRAAGTLGNPNVAGAYLAALLPFALALERPPWLRPLLSGILGAALLATGSRGGWLAACAGAAYFLARRRSPSLPLFLALVLAAALLPWPPGRRLLAGLTVRDPTAAARLTVWRRAVALFLARPVAGWGYDEVPLGWAPHPHNLVLEILVGGGLLAAAGFVPLALRLGRILFGRRVSGAAAPASLLALLVFGLADAVLGTPALAALFWLDVGIVLGEGSGGGEAEPAAAPRPAGGSGGSRRGGLHLPPGPRIPPRAPPAGDNPEPGDGDARPE